ncbi:hypothetical protein DWB84_08560 [Saccharophagus sp. K07]|uniref:L,D-transpeptidase family protein n=1 Tax=Saccharophagus sp. K07 TaxID=2283636 RepID=UPI001651E778|nr:L,D-transpeptidase family protein [Saccharophagus sp. K07]MBC6905505.1 hypothetical protein [Saccharophagus sp. K07]
MSKPSSHTRRWLLSAVALALSSYTVYTYARPLWVPLYRQATGARSVQDVQRIYGDKAQARLKPFFESAKAPYPPKSITLLAIKDEKKLELWSEDNGERYFIRSYPIKAASGITGPKLKQGDEQVPEGIYRLEYLNPNSLYHLSMKINYPNEFDREQARKENRSNLGGDIFIHGKAVSIGCLAIGDPAIEELFTLVAQIGIKNVKVIIAPSDARKHDLQPLATNQRPWVKTLYQTIADAVQQYQVFENIAAAEGSTPLMQKCH